MRVLGIVRNVFGGRKTEFQMGQEIAEILFSPNGAIKQDVLQLLQKEATTAKDLRAIMSALSAGSATVGGQQSPAAL